jgi:hypothetical protein
MDRIERETADRQFRTVERENYECRRSIGNGRSTLLWTSYVHVPTRLTPHGIRPYDGARRLSSVLVLAVADEICDRATFAYGGGEQDKARWYLPFYDAPQSFAELEYCGRANECPWARRCSRAFRATDIDVRTVMGCKQAGEPTARRGTAVPEQILGLARLC